MEDLEVQEDKSLIMEIFNFSIDRATPINFLLTVHKEKIICTYTISNENIIFTYNFSNSIVEEKDKCLKNMILFIVSILQKYSDNMAANCFQSSIHQVLSTSRVIDRLGWNNIKQAVYIEYVCNLFTFTMNWIKYCSISENFNDDMIKETRGLLSIFFSLRRHIIGE